MNKELLASLLKPSDTAEQTKRYTIRIDGQIKTGKTTLALTASSEVGPMTEWSPDKPREVNDLLWIGFEENCLMFAETRGVKVKNFLNWSKPGLTYDQIRPAILALPEACKEYAAAGVKTIVVDSLSAFDDLLIRDLVTMGGHTSDMARIRAYGAVNEAHMLFFDMLRKTGMNILGLVHLVEFAPFGEEGGSSQVAQQMARQAAKAVDRAQAAAVGGERSNFIAAMRPKASGRWARLSDAVLVTYTEQKVIRAGVTETQYRFREDSTHEFSAGGRWDLRGPQLPCLWPVIQRLYGLSE